MTGTDLGGIPRAGTGGDPADRSTKDRSIGAGPPDSAGLLDGAGSNDGGGSNEAEAGAGATDPPRPASHRRRPAVPRPVWLSGAVALAAVVLTIAVMPPPQPFDPWYVWHYAQLWPNLELSLPVAHHGMRLGTLLPTRFAQELVGENQLSMVIAAAMLLAIFAIGVYLLGRTLFSDVVGLVAVAILLVSPFFTLVDGYFGFTNASTGNLYPDHAAGGWFLLGIAALVVGSRRDGRGQIRWLVLAGVCFGAAYLTREFLAFMFVGIPVYFLLLRIPWRRVVATAIPMLTLLGLELLHNAVVWGDALARFTVASEHGTRRAEPLSRWFVLRGFVEAMGTHWQGWIFVGALVVTVAGVVAFRDRRLILLLVTFVTLWLPLTLVGGMIDPYEYSLRIQLPRYWYAVLPVVLIGALGTITLAIRRLGSPTARRVSVVALVLLSLVYLVPAAGAIAGSKRDEDWRALQTWLVEHPEVTSVVIDDRSRQTLLFYQRTLTGDPVWRGKVRTFTRRAPTLPVDLIGHDTYLETILGARQRPDPAAGWRVVWRSPNGVITIWQR